MLIKLSELKQIIHEVEANVSIEADPLISIGVDQDPVPHARYGVYHFWITNMEHRAALIEDGKLVRGIL